MSKRFYFPNVRQRIDDGRYFVPTRVAGVSHYQDAVSHCYESQPLVLVRESENIYDSNAIMVFAGGSHIGYIPRKDNEWFALQLDKGHIIDADIYKVVLGDGYKSTIGVRINVYFPEGARLEFDEENLERYQNPSRHTEPSSRTKKTRRRPVKYYYYRG